MPLPPSRGPIRLLEQLLDLPRLDLGESLRQRTLDVKVVGTLFEHDLERREEGLEDRLGIVLVEGRVRGEFSDFAGSKLVHRVVDDGKLAALDLFGEFDEFVDGHLVTDDDGFLLPLGKAEERGNVLADVKGVDEVDGNVTRTGDGSELVGDVNGDGHGKGVALDFVGDEKVGEVAVENGGPLERRGFHSAKDFELARTGREVLGDPDRIRDQLQASERMRVRQRDLLFSHSRTPNVRDVPLGNGRLVRSSDQVEFRVECTHTMHGRDDGVDLVIFEYFDERIDGGVVGNHKGSTDLFLLDLVNLSKWIGQ